jgi:Chaperone of endosialidase
MNRPNLLSNATLPHVASLISRSPLWRGFPAVLLVLGLFALSPTARAADPPPDGGYPGNNTAEGDGALSSVQIMSTTGIQNTAIGFKALQSNTSGNGNTAIGNEALLSNTTGSENTANGGGALFHNMTGNFNTAMGVAALDTNTAGSFNTATGINALFSNTTGSNNTANGLQALFHNTIGGNNTAHGEDALFINTTGSNNTATGFQALFGNRTGNGNIALGFGAGFNLTSGSNNIYIGNQGASESHHIRIGTVGTQTATFIAGISGATVASGVGVIVGSNGRLGTVVSSERFKDDVKPMEKASEAVLALKPVTFRYKQELDPDAIPQFGLIAEQVEKVNPELVVRGDDGKVMTVRYEAVNAMLLNEFLKEHRKVEEQQSTIAELKTTVGQQQKQIVAQQATAAQQQEQIEALAATVSRVRERVELSARAPRVAANED